MPKASRLLQGHSITPLQSFGSLHNHKIPPAIIRLLPVQAKGSTYTKQ
jgi:hypothetical protein